MKIEQNSFVKILEINDDDCITVTGGGGKTSLLFLLMKELTDRGIPSMITTTTKMWYPENFGGTMMFLDQFGGEQLSKAIKQCLDLQLFVAAARLSDNKVSGLSPEMVDSIFENDKYRIILNEGDGSAGKPAKIYHQGEPVIPQKTNRLFHLIGCEVWNEPLGRYLHRCPPELEVQRFNPDWFIKQLLIYAKLVKRFDHAQSDLIINKAEGEYFTAACEMAVIAQVFFKAVYIASIQEGWIINSNDVHEEVRLNPKSEK